MEVKQKSTLEKVLEIENKLKQQCQKEYNKYKERKRKTATVKVRYFKFLGDQEVTELYNKRNDNDDPWFPIDLSPESFKKEDKK